MVNFMPGRIEFDMNFSTATQGKRRRSVSSPMQILLMGDFSGSNDSSPNFPIHPLDLDNFEALLAKLLPRVELVIGTGPKQVIAIEFKTLDDFHPDRLFERLAVFQQLKTLRSDLQNPATFEQAVTQLSQEERAKQPETGKPEQTTAPATPVEQNANLLDELLGDRAANIASEPTAVKGGRSVDISAFIKNAVAPHIESGPHPQQEHYIASVDQAIGDLMRAILHHPQFQALEAVWRGTYECLGRLELDESLKLYVLDASKEQLQQDFQQATPQLSASLVYQSLVERTVQTLGGDAWSLLIGLYTFSSQPGDIECLKALGQLASHAGGPFLAAADCLLLGCDSLAIQADASQWRALSDPDRKAWNELRDYPCARWLGLIFPGFLLRLPYGSKTDTIECFEFEEFPPGMTEEHRHDRYLWGSGAVAAAVLIGQSYQQNAWSMQPGDVLELDDLPWHVYESNDGKTIKPCAEALMSERSAESIESLGVMPLMSYKNKNAVRLWRFRSLARQNAGLAGPWED